MIDANGADQVTSAGVLRVAVKQNHAMCSYGSGARRKEVMI